MIDFEHGELRVDVPVGFLLPERQEVTVSVCRPDGRPLPIRLRLIPAHLTVPARPITDEEDTVVDGDALRTVLIPSRRDRHRSTDEIDGYPAPDVGGGD